MFLINFVLSILLAIWVCLPSVLVASENTSKQQSHWIAYYGAELPASAFAAYDLVVLDNENHALVPPLVDKDKVVLAYLSLGEVEQHRPWYSSVKAEGLLMLENENRPGRFLIDIRDPRWTSRVIEERIPAILRRGFHGVLLDNLDRVIALERENPEKFSGMADAAAQLVLTIRRHYPEIKIMMTRSYEILPHVGLAIDMELGEAVYSNYNFTDKEYQLVDTELQQQQVSQLQAVANEFPDLKIYTLDYWRSNDQQGIARIYKQQRENGFIPLVSKIDLDEIVPFPPITETAKK